MNLALGMSKDDAVAKATGKSKEQVNKYAYAVVKNKKVVEAYDAYIEQFRKKAYVTKELLEAEAARMVFQDKKISHKDKLGFMRFIADINGYKARDKNQEDANKIKTSELLLGMTNEIKGQ